MTTFTEIVASVVIQSSAVALSHFGVTMAPAQVDRVTPPPVERVIARTPAPRAAVATPLKLAICRHGRAQTQPIKT